MEEVPARVDFPAQEEETLRYWTEIDAFRQSIEMNKDKPPFSFYDGPPFATGLPHFGHILAGTIKDTVTRYAHQTGHHVERRFGWDTHGLPVEFEIDKALGITGSGDVLKMGIDKYNAECRKIVMRYSSEWRTVITRLGRWIDFDNDYKTLNPTYMESVWWAFSQLHKKGLVYQGFKVMPYSIGCATPLSNFEANQNYKDVSDPSVMITMPLVGDTASIIIWTTTPWTLPSNLAICLHPEYDYVRVKSTADGKEYIVAAARADHVFPPPKKAAKGAAEGVNPSYTVLATLKGADLKGKEYVPPMPIFEAEWRSKGAFRVLNDKYVTADGGTGCVHCAPAFGEDDYRVCIEAGIVAKGPGILCPVDSDGKFTDEVPDYAGVMVKDADKPILAALKAAGRVFSSSSFVHAYPFCWRSDTPLIYKAVPSWFIRVEGMRDALLKNNAETMWVPDFVQEKRFAGWLRDARDWAVSRNRFWGTPLPMWVSEDLEEVVCVGSVDELEALSGVRVTDLHRESIDHITIPSKMGKGDLRRTPEVFDCWFESGSMPYAQNHFPFAYRDADGNEDTSRFHASFPADFIAEGVDQTRGWFYTLLVLGTALFDKAPFKNLIANGLVLAADGKKMSKRLKNYPDPTLVVDEYGADALRMYLINSPVVRAMNLCFKSEGVKDCLKDVLLPWQNAYRFFVTSAGLWAANHNGEQFKPRPMQVSDLTNVMDRWVLASTQTLISFVRGEMEGYRLYTVIPALVQHIEALTNWYIRLNRQRLKGGQTAGGDNDDGDDDGEANDDGDNNNNNAGDADTAAALGTLFEVLMTMCQAMAPFTPYIVEAHYQNLKKLLPESERMGSVHFLPFPEVREELRDPATERAVRTLTDVIELGRVARDRRSIGLRLPLRCVKVLVSSEEALSDLVGADNDLLSYVRTELNVREVQVVRQLEGVSHTAHLNGAVLGKKFGADFKDMLSAARSLSSEDVVRFMRDGSLEIAGNVVAADECEFRVHYDDPDAPKEPAAEKPKEEETPEGESGEGGKKKKGKGKKPKKDADGGGDKDAASKPQGRYEAAARGATVVLLDTQVDEALVREGVARGFTNRIQRLRKKGGMAPTDPCEIFYRITRAAEGARLPAVLADARDTIAALCKRTVLPMESKPSGALRIVAEQCELDGVEFELEITRPAFACRADRFADAKQAALAELVLNSLDRDGVLARLDASGSGSMAVSIEGAKVNLVLGENFFNSAADRS